LEAEKVLGVKAAVVLSSGLDIESYPRLDEISVGHGLAKSRLQEFAMYYFFPYYQFDLSNTSFFFTSSGYDIKKNGIDVLIKSLGRLNKRLKKSKKTAVTFFFVPAHSKGIKNSLMKNKTAYHGVKSLVDEHEAQIKEEIVNSIITKSHSTSQLSRLIGAAKENPFHKKGNPPLLTHDLAYERNDTILQLFKKHSLLNKKEDNVKVVLYPADPILNDGLLNLNYENMVMGFNLGIFPSCHEQFSHKPLETMALGVPAVTTKKSGLGWSSNKPDSGLCIIPRKNDNEFVSSLAQYLYNFVNVPHDAKVKLRLDAKRIAQSYDWRFMSGNYIQAYNLAVMAAFS